MSHLEKLLERIHRPTWSGCWEWVGSKNRDGYGNFTSSGKTSNAHRLVYEHFVGPIPDGLQIDHLCRNRCCVNPAHLEPVTSGENTRRGRSANRERTHCAKGHAFNEANTYYGGGRRNCRVCNRIAKRRRHEGRVA